MPARDDRSALVVGAGIAGLTAAWHLASYGWRVTVLEQAPALRSSGYMMSLSGPGYDVTRAMGLLPALQAHHTPIDQSVCMDRDGRELWQLSYPEALNVLEWITLSRSDLVRELYAACGSDVDVRFGTTVTELTQVANGCSVTLSTGETMLVDIVIGADGVHSPTRRMLFGDASFTESLGYRCSALLLPDAFGLGHNFMSYAEPGRVTEFYTLSDGVVACLFVWRDPDTRHVRTEDSLDVLRQAYAGAHPLVQEAIDGGATGEPVYFDNLELVDLPRWSEGRCVLIGDAAHCLTLVSGQGASLAIASAWKLAKALQSNDVASALASHEAILRPLIARLQVRSRRIAKGYVPKTRWGFFVRNLVMRNIPAQWLGKYLVRSVQSEVADLMESNEAVR